MGCIWYKYVWLYLWIGGSGENAISLVRQKGFDFQSAACIQHRKEGGGFKSLTIIPDEWGSRTETVLNLLGM